MKYLKILTLIIFYFFLTSSNFKISNVDLVNEISKNIRCIVCQGQSVYDSESEFANSVKQFIKKKIEEGSTENQIYESLKNQYGEWILYDPEFNKNTIFLWLLPILIFIIGGLIFFKKTKFLKL
tara:strand:+ start:565 stop:936 length:372 start_codon:yes stop_codon:yes gene_type:complete